MMHFNMEYWKQMCEFFRSHDPQHVHYKKGHFVKCPGLKRHARPYQAYIVWFMFRMKTENIHGGILAEGIGMGKTFETMLYCWVQTAVVAAGQDVERSRNTLASPEVRERHLLPSTKEKPQAADAKCPSQKRWGVQCPCVERSLSFEIYGVINVGPALIAVPPKLIPQWRQEFEQTFDSQLALSPAHKMQLFIEHHEHLKFSFASKSREDNINQTQLYPDGCKHNCTRFIVLTASNKTISSRVHNSTIYKSRIPKRSFWSVMFWDEFHETRNPTSVHCLFFSQQMLLRPDCRTYPSIIGLSGTPIVRSVKDITCIVKCLEDDDWSEEDHEMYRSSTKSIDLLAKRYNDLLKEGEAARESARNSGKRLSKSQTGEEKEKRRVYSSDLNQALLQIMVVRRSTDLWFGQSIVDLPKLKSKYVMVDTAEEYLPYIQKLAVEAKEKADAVWTRRLKDWKDAGSKAPQPIRNDTTLQKEPVFLQVRFCASFPALAKLLQSVKSGEEFSLLAKYIYDKEIYTTDVQTLIDSTWYGKHFSKLIEGSQKLKELDKFLDEMDARSPEVQATDASDEDDMREKMIIGCSSPPLVAVLRLVST
jgi:hypothetical protein